MNKDLLAARKLGEWVSENMANIVYNFDKIDKNFDAVNRNLKNIFDRLDHIENTFCGETNSKNVDQESFCSGSPLDILSSRLRAMEKTLYGLHGTPGNPATSLLVRVDALEKEVSRE